MGEHFLEFGLGGGVVVGVEQGEGLGEEGFEVHGCCAWAWGRVGGEGGKDGWVAGDERWEIQDEGAK